MTPPNIQRRGNTSPSQTFLKNCRGRNASELTQQSQHHPDTKQRYHMKKGITIFLMNIDAKLLKDK